MTERAGERDEPEVNVCERHHFTWTWPIEGGSGSVGVCDLCGCITTGERDGIKKAEALRETADYFEGEMGNAWGGPLTWMTTGTSVAALVAYLLREQADEITTPAGVTP